MATQVMIQDPDLEKYLDDVAKANGGMGRATAARFIIAEHRRMTSSRDEIPAPEPRGDEQEKTSPATVQANG